VEAAGFAGRQNQGVTSIFNSSQIPGEILDLLVIRTEVLKRATGRVISCLKRCRRLYETMSKMAVKGPAGDQVLKMIGEASKTRWSLTKNSSAPLAFLHAAGSAADHQVGRPEAEDDPGAAVLFHPRLAWQQDPIAGRYCHPLPGRRHSRQKDRVACASMRPTWICGWGSCDAVRHSRQAGAHSGGILSWSLFAVGVALLSARFSAAHVENPEDRVMPTVAQMEGCYRRRAPT